MMNRKGFTLLELMVVVGVLSILAMTVAPGLLKLQVEKKFTDSLKNDIMNVLDAARQYRFDCGQWPANITNLTSPPPGCSGNPSQNPYLPPGFQLTNPFGGAITFSGQPNFFSLNVPVNAQYNNMVEYFRDLPGFTQTPDGFQVSVVRPGLEVALSNLPYNQIVSPTTSFSNFIDVHRTTAGSFNLCPYMPAPQNAKYAIVVFYGVKADGWPTAMYVQNFSGDYFVVYRTTGSESSAGGRVAGPNTSLLLLPLIDGCLFYYYWDGDTSGWYTYTSHLIAFIK